MYKLKRNWLINQRLISYNNKQIYSHKIIHKVSRHFHKKEDYSNNHLINKYKYQDPALHHPIWDTIKANNN